MSCLPQHCSRVLLIAAVCVYCPLYCIYVLPVPAPLSRIVPCAVCVYCSLYGLRVLLFLAPLLCSAPCAVCMYCFLHCLLCTASPSIASSLALASNDDDGTQ